jgi:DNA-directed RNA polymerase subunit F
MSEREALERAYPGEILNVLEFNKLYVVKVSNCDPEKARIFKENLKKMGFKKLTKRVVVSCR